MSGLDEAMERFSQALDRLETSLARRVAGQRADSDLERELKALREDRARLQRELDAARSEYGRLEKVTDEVSERLDGTIGELRSVLGEKA
ncbi:MAG: DUF4164 family protein [Alphaproteobacteria bacterium]|nr:DUF4164 family protein [Alphaproteobacteria bacterium]